MSKLSVVLAVHNEEKILGECLASVKDIADELIIVDGASTDKTVEIARKYGAKIIKKDNPPIFHINKQIALENAENEWILQLDADERVTLELAKEIEKVVGGRWSVIKDKRKQKLFEKHQKLIEKRDGSTGKDTGEIVAYFVPRLNYFLGKYLRYGGVYPDGVIRLVKKGKARFPCKSVHEQIEIDGKVGWLANDLVHMADPTFKRYLERNSRYIDLIAQELKEAKVGKNPIQLINYMIIKPVWWFFLTLLRHKGILDGWQGIVFSFFSALRFPRAYFRYLIRS